MRSHNQLTLSVSESTKNDNREQKLVRVLGFGGTGVSGYGYQVSHYPFYFTWIA